MIIALKELEPYVRNGEHLQTGKPSKNFGGMLSREMWANWLLCAAVGYANGVELTFSTDPIGGDGIIYDNATGETWPTEHVMVPRLRLGQNGSTESLILKAIAKKHCKGGKAYATGKTLVVFLNIGAGEWYPDRIMRRLPDPLHFAAVWVVALQTVEAKEYAYAVTSLDLSKGNAPIFCVRIGKEFDNWTVTPLQQGQA